MGDFYILDDQYRRIGIVDGYESFIWTDRYDSFGDFEVYLPATTSALALYQIDNLIEKPSGTSSAGQLAFVEEVEIVNDDPEVGPMLTVRGRSLESLMARRIVWEQTIFNNALITNAIQILFHEAFGINSGTRHIPEVRFGSPELSSGSTLRVTTQFTGQPLSEAVYSILQDVGWGLKARYESGQFEFVVFNGLDRSTSQTDRPQVIFSPSLDNLKSSHYTSSVFDLGTVALVAGEGEGSDRRVNQYHTGIHPSGIKRREKFIDARDLSSNDGEVTNAVYNQMLIERGKSKMVEEHSFVELFSGEGYPDGLYSYGTDYNLGDIVELVDEFGNNGSVRVSEYIWVSDAEGIRSYPTFTTI